MKELSPYGKILAYLPVWKIGFQIKACLATSLIN